MIYRKAHIPKTTPNKRRPGVRMSPTTLTIHNTGNPKSTAANERAWLTNPENARQASFHIVVDEKEAIECLPLTEHAWHAGDGNTVASGNRTSIGIELCESGNYAKTLDNAVELVASMLKERGWNVDRLRRHYGWSGKICPRLMFDEGTWKGWLTFKNRVAACMTKEVNQPMTPEEKKSFEELQETVKTNSKRIADLEEQRDIPAPDWAKDAAIYYKDYIATKTGSYDFWRTITIQYRQAIGNKV